MADFGRSTLPENSVLRAILVVATVAGVLLAVSVADGSLSDSWLYLAVPLLVPGIAAFLAHKIS